MFRISNTFVNLSSSLHKNSSKGVQKAFEMYHFVCLTQLKTFCGIYSIILAQMPFFINRALRYILMFTHHGGCFGKTGKNVIFKLMRCSLVKNWFVYLVLSHVCLPS